MGTTNKQQLAWAAGLLDGEGCFYSSKDKGRNYPRLKIAQSGSEVPEVLLRFNTAIGGLGLIRVWARPGKKLPYHLTVHGFDNVQAVMEMLWPWLGAIKKEQARKVLAEYSGKGIKEWPQTLI